MFVFVDDADVVTAAFGKQRHSVVAETVLRCDTGAVRHDLTDDSASVATGHLDADLVRFASGGTALISRPFPPAHASDLRGRL